MCNYIYFERKTAYEIKECDWSSDVCSSDLGGSGLVRALCNRDKLRAFCFFDSAGVVLAPGAETDQTETNR